MFLKRNPFVFVSALRYFGNIASGLELRLKISAALVALGIAAGLGWIQPTFANSVVAPVEASFSLSGISAYIWSFFSHDGRRRIPTPRPARDIASFGSRESLPQTSSAAPCSPSGVTLNVPGTYPTIQAAINAANPSGGDTIAVAAGSYTEQISAGKCVSIVGSGVSSTTIFAPATMVDSTVPGGSARAIVEARANAYVTVKDLSISGPVTFSPTSGTFGVFVAESATLNMRNVRVTTIQQSSGINSAQDGQGIVAGDTTFGTAGSLDLDGVTIDGYQENGILVGGAGSSATIANTTVTGTGPTSLIAQSGIQIYGGASGVISSSTVNDNLYSLNSGAATGILTADAGAVSVSGSAFSGNSYAIYQYNSALPLTPSNFSATACTFTNNPGAGIVYSAAASPTITNNFISGSNIGIAGFVADNQTSTVKGNSITNATGANSVAIFFNDFSSSVNTTLATVNANFNRLSSNNTGGLAGLQNDSASSVNAENNWWGCNAGPGATGCDIVAGTGPGVVDSDPWLTLSGITASPVSLNYSQTSTISGVNLCTNSAAATVCSPADHTPDSLSVAYSTSPGTNGSVAPASGAFTTGVAAGTTFTATSGPIVGNQIENVGAIFDNQTIATAITILDPSGGISISGRITAYTGGAGIDGVTVTLTGTSSGSPVNLSTTTASGGNFAFSGGLFANGSYSIIPSCPSDPQCSAFTFDASQRDYLNPPSSITTADFVGYNGDNPRDVVIKNTTQTPVLPGQPAGVGANITVPIQIASQGTENAMAFTLVYDSSKLQFLSAACDPSLASLGCGITQPGPGGSPTTLTMALQPGAVLPASATPATALLVTFKATPGTSTSTPLAFNTIPSSKSVSNNNGYAVPADWIDGVVSFAGGFEGDVAGGQPASSGIPNGQVTSGDITRILNLVSHNTTPNPNVNEYQRADCAPIGTFGNGLLTSGDVTVALRYANGDLVGIHNPAAGASTGLRQTQVPRDRDSRSPSLLLAPGDVSVLGALAAPGSTVAIDIELEGQGIEAGFGFTLEFDPNVLSLSTPGGVSEGADVSTYPHIFSPNISQASSGRIGVVYNLTTFGASMTPAGPKRIVHVTFLVNSAAVVGSTTPISFSDAVSIREVNDVDGNSLTPNWGDGVIEISLSPTAAESSVGGQVRTNDGRGIGNTVVTLTGVDGVVRRALTNSFGYYRIDNVPTGATYALGATSKRYAFDTRVITVGDNITDADLTPRE
ncbi:MAG TPA: hypothetical protein PKC65_13075 [Pyrinomonadaceae bacterium]|nr:hypothetical protein [Pyrinomonadaceae bacterium]